MSIESQVGFAKRVICKVNALSIFALFIFMAYAVINSRNMRVIIFCRQSLCVTVQYVDIHLYSLTVHMQLKAQRKAS